MMATIMNEEIIVHIDNMSEMLIPCACRQDVVLRND